MKKFKHREDRQFGFRSFIRLLIFIALLASGIIYISDSLQPKTNDPTILGTESSQITVPKPVEDITSQILSSPGIISIQDQIVRFQEEKLNGFPQKQFKEIQKNVLKSILQQLMDNVDKQ